MQGDVPKLSNSQSMGNVVNTAETAAATYAPQPDGFGTTQIRWEDAI
jgi:hypothetical protein